jgi:hypothetical protein
MGKVKIPYYVVKKGFGYWQPTKAMRAEGWQSIRCGRDGPEAWRTAQEWAGKYRASRADPRIPSRAPKGSIAEAFERYRATDEWARKALRTREEWERCWKHLMPLARLRPVDVSLEIISAFRSSIGRRISLREAHRALKIWRALWRVCAAFQMCHADADPSQGVRNREPDPRKALWTEGEAVRKIKNAWRLGYHGLAALMAVGWDTQLSPVDLRKLCTAQRAQGTPHVSFKVRRGKTNREVNVTLGRRSTAILVAYLKTFDADPLANAPIFRNRSGHAYSKDTLGDDFRAIRGDGETRTLADFRRSGTVEAIRGGATAEDIGIGMGNDFARSKLLQKTYAPTDFSAHAKVREARRKGRS